MRFVRRNLPKTFRRHPDKKDKSEEELKSQIKKLQRIRDQLKAWLTTEEIRDKDPLIIARRNIETRMELFKKAGEGVQDQGV